MITKNNLLLIYKLLETILSLLLFGWLILLLAESILPGLISKHLSFLKLIVLILVIFISLIYIGKKIKKTAQPQKNSTYLVLMLVFSTLVFILSLWKFPLIVIIIIALTTTALVYLLESSYLSAD